MEKRIQFLGIFLSLLIFGLIYFSPASFHLEFLYSLIVLLTIWIQGNRSTFDASVAMSGLIVLGYFLNNSFRGASDLVGILYPLMFIWAFTFSIIKYKQSQENLNRSTEYLNAMFKHATEGIIISNKKGLIIMANPRAANQFGYEEKELEGLSIEDLVPKRFGSVHGSHRTHYFKDPKNRSMGRGMSLFARRKDDSEFPVEISLSSFSIKDQVFVISFIIDITERKRQEDLVAEINEQLEGRVETRTRELAESNDNLQKEMAERAIIQEALRDSERLYSTMARNFPNGIICVLNKKLEIVFIDGKELQVFGMKPDELIGKSVKVLLPLSDPAEITNQLVKVFNWESIAFEMPFREYYYNLIAVPLPDMKGFVKDILLVIQNVTELKKAADEILHALDKERTLNEMKSKFVSIASHEFRTPLSTILTSVTLIDKYQNPEDTEKRLKHIDRIKSSVKNLTEILNDFLSLEKLEAGKIETKLSTFDLPKFAEDLNEELQALSKKGQRIEYTHSGEERLVTMDRQLLRNICINLLNNAIKYSPEDSIIELQSHINDTIELVVKDHGIGIPKEDQSHLFERFFRAANVTAIQGTGLGLNIVKRYVQLMKGSIKFESEVNSGTTFTLNFPKEPTSLL
ncbi:MAG: PAS domain-containing sensor histidine kinase [Bacteroidetes bacterium]|nr:MAG: PAS domain-containing sensor histidine kinase [Bacteroidota bacterium]